MNVKRVDTWAASIKDKPGALAEKLKVLAKGGANLEFVIARRCPDKAGTAVVFVTPIKGRSAIRAAKEARFSKAKGLHDVRVEGPNRKGQGAKITAALAAAGISLRGLSGAAIGKNSVCHVAVDSASDANKAVRILKAL